jgi:hypothetical protein
VFAWNSLLQYTFLSRVAVLAPAVIVVNTDQSLAHCLKQVKNIYCVLRVAESLPQQKRCCAGCKPSMHDMQAQAWLYRHGAKRQAGRGWNLSPYLLNHAAVLHQITITSRRRLQIHAFCIACKYCQSRKLCDSVPWCCALGSSAQAWPSCS